MTDSTTKETQKTPRDAAYWATQTDAARLSAIPSGARNLNVEGKQAVGPLQGFGPMWQKTYRIRLQGCDATPKDVIAAWKENFPKFWPPGNTFYAPLTGIAPGEAALINSSLPGGMPLSTGVMVLYADDESFTLMTTQGHPFSGWVTFSARVESEGGDTCTVAQAQVLMRANDPLYAVGMRFGGHKQEDKIWQWTLTSLAKHFGVEAEVDTSCQCVDRRPQWRRAGNLWYNAGIRSGMYMMAAPIRLATRPFGKTELR
ncbi:MAG TPA: hypothetical protein VFB34_06435 [Chloroflexota bacterium]|nr:hypothetical protein [Chloroflexota bacterium]